MIRLSPGNLFHCHNPKVIKFVTRLQFGLSHLTKHILRHIQDTLNPFCDCGWEAERTAEFLFRCPQFFTERSTLLKKIKSIDTSMVNQIDSNFTVLFRNLCNSTAINTQIINATIDFVVDTKRFNDLLF